MTELVQSPITATHYLRTLTQARFATENRQWQAAAELWQDAVAANPVDGNNWYRLAEATFAAGDYRAAVGAYEQALALGVWERHVEPVLPPQLNYQLARCHARLGDTAAARQALADAFDAGYRDTDQVWADEHLASLRSEDWFMASYGPPEADLFRYDGWRADLRLLVREVQRRSYHLHARIDVAAFRAAADRLDQDIPQLTDARILVEMKRLMAMLDDGHAFVLPQRNDTTLRRALPVLLYQFVEGVFITATAPEHARLLGARVLAFDDQPIADVWRALDPLIARDNDHWTSFIAPQLMRQTVIMHGAGVLADPGQATLTVDLADGTTSKVTLPADALASPLIETEPCPPGWRFLPHDFPGELPHYLRNPAAPYWFDVLAPERMAYVQWNSIADARAEPLDRFWDRLLHIIDQQRLDRLVIDLRANGGGNTFLTVPVLHRLIGHQRINQRGNLFVVIGRNTFSAAQNFTTELARHTHAIFVGEPTGSRPNFVGETVPFTLPYSKLLANVSDLYWQTSWPLDHRSWIAPDLYAPPTFADFAANRDAAMEAIRSLAGERLPGW
jgi:tetratricopeptide (TPR) repeat protein